MTHNSFKTHCTKKIVCNQDVNTMCNKLFSLKVIKFRTVYWITLAENSTLVET